MSKTKRLPGEIPEHVPEKIKGIFSLTGKSVKVLFNKIKEVENRTGCYYSRERAINSLLSEIYEMKYSQDHISHP